MKVMIRILTILCSLFALVFTAACEENKSRVDWLSMDEGLAIAREEEKHLVVDFYTSWCRWCEVMDRRTFSDEEVAQYLGENFVCVRVNAEDRQSQFSYEGRDLSPFILARQFGVRGYPSMAYLESDGDLIMLVPGFIPPQKYIRVLEYFREGHYKKGTDLEKFMETGTG